jgi:hypothetical protein
LAIHLIEDLTEGAKENDWPDGVELILRECAAHPDADGHRDKKPSHEQIQAGQVERVATCSHEGVELHERHDLWQARVDDGQPIQQAFRAQRTHLPPELAWVDVEPASMSTYRFEEITSFM